MLISSNKWRLHTRAFLLLILICSFPLSAREINVRGKVTNHKGDPIYRVSIVDAETNKPLAYTNEDGKYMVKTDSKASLGFSHISYKDLTVEVKNNNTLDVVMEPTSQTLNELVVVGKGKKKKKVLPPETELIVKGNYLHMTNPIPFYKGSFSTDNRAIVQPILYNVTRKQNLLMAPLVVDGEEYALTQERMHDFDLAQDPLTPYVDDRRINTHVDDYVIYRDSVFVDNPNDDFNCVMVVSLENYNRIFSLDSVKVAQGTVNPLRHLEFDFEGLPISDESYYPTPEPQLRDSKGDVNLIFKVNRSDLDLNEGNNMAELERVRTRLIEIENDPDSKLKSFVITGTASPEGVYTKNYQLAERRMNSAMNLISDVFSDDTKESSDIRTVVSVEPWDRVVEMLRADSLFKEADEVQTVINTYPKNRDRQSRAITSLPYYREVIATQYLPRLRRLSYEISYSHYRPLSDQEVDELYRAGKYTEIPRYDFWKLYNRTSIDEREAVCRRALEVYPKFVMAANDLAATLIDKKKPDTELLQPYLALPDIPHEIRYNQVAAWLLSNSNLTKADSLAGRLPEVEAYHKVKIYAEVLSGNYSEEAFQEVSESSPINEVVMLLVAKEDEKAWEKAQKLGNTAKEDYIKAIASNRLAEDMERYDLLLVAEDFLQSAMAKDPSLRELARVDGDLVKLLKQIEDREKRDREYEKK